MKKNKLLLLLLTFLVVFVSCSDDDDAPAYEQVLLNHAASDGLYGKVKSTETISYYSDWDSEKESILVSNPDSKIVKAYDSRGYMTGYAYYWYESNETSQYNLIHSESYKYDKRYRKILIETEDYYNYKQKLDVSYDDKSKKGTVIVYTWNEEKKEYEKTSTKVYPLLANGTLDESVYEEYREYNGYYYGRLHKSKSTASPSHTKERVVVKEDGKNWITSYMLDKDFDVDGKVYYKYGYDFQERVITYY